MLFPSEVDSDIFLDLLALLLPDQSLPKQQGGDEDLHDDLYELEPDPAVSTSRARPFCTWYQRHPSVYEPDLLVSLISVFQLCDFSDLEFGQNIEEIWVRSISDSFHLLFE